MSVFVFFRSDLIDVGNIFLFVSFDFKHESWVFVFSVRDVFPSSITSALPAETLLLFDVKLFILGFSFFGRTVSVVEEDNFLFDCTKDYFSLSNME